MSHLPIHSIYQRPSTAHLVVALWTSPGFVIVLLVGAGMVAGVGIAQGIEKLRAITERNHR